MNENHFSPKNSGETGQAILESLFCMLLLCLILFGIVQLFMLYMTDNAVKYAAFLHARSQAVGFKEFFSTRAAHGAVVPVSGRHYLPFQSKYSTKLDYRKMPYTISKYVSCKRSMHMEYWGNHPQHISSSNIAPYKNGRPNSFFRTSAWTKDESVHSSARFINYPLSLPMRLTNFGSESKKIARNSALKKYFHKYLNEI